MNKKSKNDFISKLLKYVFSLVIWPILSFFILPIFALAIKLKTFDFVSNWFLKKRSYIVDLKYFWSMNDKYRNYCILIILVIALGLIIFFNYKSWFNKFKSRFTKQDSKNQIWEYNQFTNEGDFNKFKTKFKTGEPNFILGNIDKKRTNPLCYLVNNTDAHAIVLGISGSKKTEKIVMPNIHYNISLPFEKEPNMVITDPKKQILTRTGAAFIKNGYNIKVFDFADSENSLCWNPLKQIWDVLHSKEKYNLESNDYAIAFEKINRIVDALQWPAEKNTVWVGQAKNSILTIIKFLLLYSLEDPTFSIKFFTFASVVQFLNLDTFKSGKWVYILKSNQNKNFYWKKLNSEAQSLYDTVAETLQGYLSNATDVLLAFSANLNIDRITSNINFDVNKVVRDEKPWVVFICFPDHDNTYNFLISILITQIYQASIDYANSFPNQRLNRLLQFYLEEFNSVNIPAIADWLAISRSRGIQFLMVIQAYEQLQKYNERGKGAEVIISQARLTYLLETNSAETLKSFSLALGEKEVEKETKSSNGKNESSSISIIKEPVMSVSDLKYKNPDMTIITSGGNKPIALKLKPAYAYFDYPNYIHFAEKIVLDTSVIWDFNRMKLIDFKDYSFSHWEEIMKNMTKNDYCASHKSK